MPTPKQAVEIELAQDKEAEMFLLGHILLIGKNLPPVVLGHIAPYDFFSRSNRIIYESMFALHESGTPIDILSLQHHLDSRNLLVAIGGVAYIAELLSVSAKFFKIEELIAKLRMATSRRKLAFFGNTLANRASNYTEDVLTLASEMKKLSETIKLRHSINDESSLSEIAMARLLHTEAVCQNPALAQGVPTGYKMLDHYTAGLQKGDLVILAARPGQGKTALAMNIAQVAAKASKKVLFISLEMTKEALVNRLLCSTAQVDLIDYRRGSLNYEQFTRLREAQVQLDSYGDNISILDNPKVTVASLEGLARAKKKAEGLDLLIIDYLQLIRPERSKDKRHLEVGQVSRDLKALAKELEVPILALAQMSRAVEQRSNKRPILSDLRESGDIEQDADMVWFLYYPNNDEEVQDQLKRVDLTIGKQRNGPTGVVSLMFDGKYTKFTEVIG